MHHKRPVNLDLRSLDFPPMAIVSILHRLSGIVLFLFFPVVLYFVSLSLRSETQFHEVEGLLAPLMGKVFVWIFLSALLYHLLAGIRHIIMDMGFGESLAEGRRSAIFIITLFIILAILLGCWLWLPMSQV